MFQFTFWASVLDTGLNREVKVALSSRALVPSSQKITNKFLMPLLTYFPILIDCPNKIGCGLQIMTMFTA